MLADTGARISELAALSWQQVNIATDPASIDITYNIVAKKLKDDEPIGHHRIPSTKTDSSRRSINISPTTAEALRVWHAEQKLKLGQKNTLRLVFCRDNGTITNAEMIWKNLMRPMMRELELEVNRDPITGKRLLKGNGHGRMITKWVPLVTAHTFRHTVATLLLSEGMSPVDVSKRLGHASIDVTLRVYGHAIKGNSEALALRMEEHMLGKRLKQRKKKSGRRSA